MNGCIHSKGVLLFNSENCFAIYDKTFNLSHTGPRCPPCQKEKMINNPRTSRLLQTVKMVAALSFLSPVCSSKTIDSDFSGSVNVIVTTCEIYDERETATMLNISIHCQGSSVNIISSKVFSNSVKLQWRRKTHSARQDHQTKRCHHHCFRINNFPIKIQIKFTPPTHFCFMVVSTHCRL